ncbi:hypothetical protein BU16DRAFT_574108 [Lophium mytilinum]|uniref:Secreted protein n=1 Tax=Lophium mytilinum TaxID=390894 RepID=A0A6A6QHP5_9PEZI|nr:hypothetical protein BU16DRAFT_574108 [Lophium mytilinum]
MKFYRALALLPLAAAAPTNPSLGDVTSGTPDPTEVHIKAITYGGTGCPQGSLDYVISDDRTTQRKNCQLNVDITYPGGFQYSVFSADYRGYAAIDKGITGVLKSTYYFSGQTQQTSTEYDFVGPVNGDYLKHDEADSTSVIWSPCGAEGMLNINSQVRLTSTNSSSSGLLTTDSLDAKFLQVVYVGWQTCTA